MYTLTVGINERVRIIQHESPDYLDDRVCTILCNSHDDHMFDNKVYDMRFKSHGNVREYEKYIETADIVDANNNKVGFYMIRKD